MAYSFWLPFQPDDRYIPRPCTGFTVFSGWFRGVRLPKHRRYLPSSFTSCMFAPERPLPAVAMLIRQNRALPLSAEALTPRSAQKNCLPPFLESAVDAFDRECVDVLFADCACVLEYTVQFLRNLFYLIIRPPPCRKIVSRFPKFSQAFSRLFYFFCIHDS